MASQESDLHPDGLPWLVLGHNRLGLGHSGLGSLGSGHSGLAPVALGHSGLALMVLGHSGQASLASEQYLVVCGGLAQQSDLKNKVTAVELAVRGPLRQLPANRLLSLKGAQGLQ